MKRNAPRSLTDRDLYRRSRYCNRHYHREIMQTINELKDIPIYFVSVLQNYDFKTMTFGPRSFKVSGPTVWNDLPIPDWRILLWAKALSENCLKHFYLIDDRYFCAFAVFARRNVHNENEMKMISHLQINWKYDCFQMEQHTFILEPVRELKQLYFKNMEEYWNFSELIIELTFEISTTSLQFTPSIIISDYDYIALSLWFLHSQNRLVLQK